MCLYKLVSASALLSTITRLHLDLERHSQLLHLRMAIRECARRAVPLHCTHYHKDKNKNIVSRLYVTMHSRVVSTLRVRVAREPVPNDMCEIVIYYLFKRCTTLYAYIRSFGCHKNTLLALKRLFTRFSFGRLVTTALSRPNEKSQALA